MRVLALAACWNRRESTLRSIRSLAQQKLPAGATLEICIVDDSSSDGTAAAVRDQFPRVAVVEGSGNLYWAGGMRFGWQKYAEGRSFDYLLVFNDDVEVEQDALARLIAVAQNLERDGCRHYTVCGALANQSGATTYGGVLRASCWHPLRFRIAEASAVPQSCDTLNMNFALISRAAIDRIGFLDPDFVHGRADYDFGLRLRKQGGRVVMAPGVIGRCERHDLNKQSLKPGLSFSERWQRLTSVKEQPPKERAIYFRRHGGILWPVLWAIPYVRAAVESAFGSPRRPSERDGN